MFQKKLGAIIAVLVAIVPLSYTANAQSIIVSADSNMINGLDPNLTTSFVSDLAIRPNGAPQFFVNVLQGGTEVFIDMYVHDNRGVVGANEQINNFYNFVVGVNSTMPGGDFTSADLVGIDLLITNVPNIAYTMEELVAMSILLDDGGTILFLGGEGLNFTGSTSIINAALEILGSNMRLVDERIAHNFPPPVLTSSVNSSHPLMAGVENLSIAVSGSVSGGTPLASFFEFSTNNAVLAVGESAPPSADAGPDQTVDEGTLAVALDGSGSINATNFAWTQIAGPTVSLKPSNVTVNPTFDAPFVAGNTTLTFQLIVDDGAGTFSDPDTVDVIVIDSAPSHYTCYKAKTHKDSNFFEARIIGLNDQFESNAYDTVKVERLCAPANKTPINFTDDEADEPVDLDGTHLLSYKIHESQLSCGVCSGGVDQITIQYSGTDPVSFIVDGKVTNKGPYALESVEGRDLLELFGDHKNGRMGSRIRFIDEANGDEIAAFHTSCSRPIGIGTESQSGLFTVTGGSSVRAGKLGVCDQPIPVVIKPPWDTCAACKGGVSFAKFAYNGETGVVTVTDRKGNTLFDSGAPLAAGDEFEILPAAGKDKLEKTIFLTGAGDTVDIHTSCSMPFGPGFVVGDFTVLEAASKKGGADMCPVVRIDNQFGTEFLTVKKPKRLLVPSLNDLSGPVIGAELPTDTDHYKCYDVKSLNLHKGLQVTLEDQFDTRDFVIDKAKQLCNPVEKTHGDVTPIQNEASHLVCYKIKPLQKGFCELVDPFGDPIGLPVGEVCSNDSQCGAGLFCEKEVDTQAYLLNQFGDEVVKVGKATELCVPSSKTIGVF